MGLKVHEIMETDSSITNHLHSYYLSSTNTFSWPIAFCLWTRSPLQNPPKILNEIKQLNSYIQVYPSQESNDSSPVISTQDVYSNKFCDGVPDCNVNLEDESRSFCKERFFCQAGLLVNIPKSQVCDGIINCDDGSDESNSTCPDRFFCRALNGAKVTNL